MKDILKKSFPEVYVRIKEIQHNMKQNIEDYFGKKILIIPNGHGGMGFDLRTIKGWYLTTHPNHPPCFEITRPQDDGCSLLMEENWHKDVIFLDHIEEMMTLAKKVGADHLYYELRNCV